MNQDYLEAQKKSYPLGPKPVSFPRSNGIEVAELHFQPLGISSQGDLVAIASYFHPAVWLGTPQFNEDGLKLDMGEANWIRSVNSAGKSVRLFRKSIGDAKRCQTVNIFSNDSLWVSQNANKNFQELRRQSVGSNAWVFGNSQRYDLKGTVHSALIFKNLFIVSAKDLTDWKICGPDPVEPSYPLPPWTYGLDSDKNGSAVLVSDVRAEKGGLWRFSQGNLELIPGTEEVRGNGICFLKDGSALVTRYGEPLAIPGALIHISSSYFD